jgi:hypothetical protein
MVRRVRDDVERGDVLAAAFEIGVLRAVGRKARIEPTGEPRRRR